MPASHMLVLYSFKTPQRVMIGLGTLRVLQVVLTQCSDNEIQCWKRTIFLTILIQKIAHLDIEA